MIRVLHTNFLHGWGGQSNRVLTECVGLVANGWDVMISAPFGSQLLKRADAAGLKTCDSVRYVGGLKRGCFKDVFAMRELLKQFQPDIVHLHGGKDSWALVQALAYRSPITKPIIIRTKHNVFPVKDHFLNRWQYGRFFDSIVCLSSAIVTQLQSKSYIDNSRLVTIPSAINAARFSLPSEARCKIREELGFEDYHFVIGMTGRLRPEKGHDVLLRAVPEIIQGYPNVRFLLIGAGSLENELSLQLAKSGHKEYVHLAGFRNDVENCLAALDLYVQPSRSEGLGTSLLEASAAGLAIVASRTGGIPDVVEDGETGLLVEPESPFALAKAVRRLIENPQMRLRLGSAARIRVAERFSIEALVKSTDETYRLLLKRRMHNDWR